MLVFYINCLSSSQFTANIWNCKREAEEFISRRVKDNEKCIGVIYFGIAAGNRLGKA